MLATLLLLPLLSGICMSLLLLRSTFARFGTNKGIPILKLLTELNIVLFLECAEQREQLRLTHNASC